MSAGSLMVDLRSPRPISDDEIVHPVLAWVGSVAAYWASRWAFHAAGFVVNGVAWVLLAPPGGGKSTAAATLASRGYTVVSDDLIVIDGQTVLAGPRSCDLREGSVRFISGLKELPDGGIRDGRWRLELPPCPLETPVGGFVELAWGDLQVSRLGVSERVSRLSDYLAIGLEPETAVSLLDLVHLPFHRVRRPADASALSTADAILSVTS